MAKVLTIYLLLYASIAMGQFSMDQKAKIITAAELLQIYNNPNVVVLDARNYHKHRSEHIPGSWHEEVNSYMNIEGNEENPEFWGLVPSRKEEFEEYFQNKGIGDDTHVVVVGDPGGAYSGRIAWQLLYWGMKEVSLLDGGFDAWKELKDPNAPTAKALEDLDLKPRAREGQTQFKIRNIPERLVTFEEIQKALESGVFHILDTRSDEEFYHTQDPEEMADRNQPYECTLKGANHTHYSKVFDKNGFVLPKEKLIAALSLDLEDQKSGYITYCLGGVRAAIVAFVLEARLGEDLNHLPRVYAGSIWEYTHRVEESQK